MAREYRKYVAEEYAQDGEYPLACTMATERMMHKYGDGIYSAFRDTSATAFMNLSPSMSIANLDAARKFVSAFRV